MIKHSFELLILPIALCNKDNVVLIIYENLPKNRIIWPKKGVRKVFETPNGYFDIEIGKRMIIK